VKDNKLPQSAMYYAARLGWRVFPLRPHAKDPYPTSQVSTNGEGGFKTATVELEAVRDWWVKWPQSNIGLACGKQSGIVVLDIDSAKGGNESLLALLVEHGQLPETPEVITGGGGRHIYFAHPGIEIRNSASKLGPGLDIRGDGGYVVAPPSIHPNGEGYLWDDVCKAGNVPLAPMPAWLISLLKDEPQPKNNGHKAPAEPVTSSIRDGNRNSTLTSLAGTMRRRGFEEDSIYLALKNENKRRCQPPLDDIEVKRISQSVARYEPADVVQALQDEEKTRAAEKQYREPLDAYRSVLQFVELMDHLDGRRLLTHIPPIDTATGGIERQALTILAARPSMGKTTLAWQIARAVAEKGGKALFYSLEMAATSLWAKAACGPCGLRWKDVSAEGASEEDRGRVVRKALELMDRYGNRLHVDDGVSTTKLIGWNIEKIRPDLVVIDHLRLVADKDESEVKRLGSITQAFKDFAKEYNCAVICLAQLNREVERESDKRPQLKDLRDSGQIEENADLVLMMYRDDYYTPSPLNPGRSITELLVRKFRDDINNQKIELLFNTTRQEFGKVGP
jgi:replicative DNA helicase